MSRCLYSSSFVEFINTSEIQYLVLCARDIMEKLSRQQEKLGDRKYRL